MALEVTSETFEEVVLNSDKPVMVDFWAEWCGPCKAVAPQVDELAESMKDDAVVVKVNIEEERELAQKYGIRSIPTFLFFKEGEVRDKRVGVLPVESMKDVILNS